MKNFGAKWLALAAVVGAVAGLSLNGCGGGGGNSAKGGSGGSASGGKGGTSAGAGGSTAGKGGSTSTAGTGGSSSTAGHGGSTSTAGTGGSGTGGSGTDGGAGTGGGCPPIATFDATNATEGFGLNVFNGTRDSGNLAIAPDGGAGGVATSTWDGNQGFPTAPGSLKLSIPFDAYGQFIDLDKNFGTAAVQNWGGSTTVKVRFKVTSGLNPDPNYPAIAQAYVQSPTYAGSYGYMTIAQTTDWQVASVDLHPTAPATGYDPSMIIQVGLLIKTITPTIPDGGAGPTGQPTAATIYVDSFWLEGCGGAGGTGGATGGTGGATGGTGGATGGTGGATGGTGGSAGAGGTAGSGGSAGAGGSAGGTAGAGGSAGAGGTAGAGGSNTDGGTTTAALYYTFPTSAQGWALGTSGTGNIAAIEGGTPPTFGWDNAVSNPTGGGSLKVGGTFTNYNQLLQVNSGTIGPPLDLTGKTVHLWVRLDSGGAGTGFSGGVQVQFFSAGFAFGQNNNQYVTLTAGNWTELTVDMSVVKAMYSGFDPSQVIMIQLQFLTGGQPEGGTFTTTSPTFHIDTITDGGTGPAPLFSTTFDNSIQGYALSAGSGVVPDGGTAPTATWDNTVGDPSPGSAKFTVTFTNYNQNVDLQVNVSPAVDLTGKTLHARVRLDSGTLPSGYIQLHASSTGYIYANGAGMGLTAGSFVDLTMNMASPAFMSTGWTATQIIQVGVQIGVGGGPEGGAFPTPTPLTFHIDSIVAQ